MARTHGLSATYNNAGCRCGECTEANRLRQQRFLARPFADVPHGTVSGYFNWGCRCGKCKPAGAIANAARRAKARGAVPQAEPAAQ